MLSVPGKVFTHILLARLQPLLTASRRPQQSGFTMGRPTTDPILALRLLSELHREFSQPLHVACIDIHVKAAFDFVDRCALWKAPRASSVPPILIQLIEHLHRGITSRVRADGHLSATITTTSGVRQSCVLAPILFCIAMDWLLSSCAGTMGVNIGTNRLTDQEYADDAVVFADCSSKWPDILANYESAAETMSLHTSWLNTKVYAVDKCHNLSQSRDKLSRQPHFTYLESNIDSSGRSCLEIHRHIGLASSTMARLSTV